MDAMSHQRVRRQRSNLSQLPVPAFLWALDTERFVVWNDQLLDLLGYTDAELAQLNWRDLLVAEEIAIAERAIAKGPKMNSVQWHWRRKDGSVIAVTLASRQTVFVDDDDVARDVYVGLVTHVGTSGVTPAAEAF